MGADEQNAVRVARDRRDVLPRQDRAASPGGFEFGKSDQPHLVGGQTVDMEGIVEPSPRRPIELDLGRRQRKGLPGGWVALAAALAIVGSVALVVPRQPQAAARVPMGAEAWSEAAVENYRAEGRPVFLYFTADWCLTCKANEAAAIEREATRDAFDKAGVKVLVGDWTNGDPAITRFLESRGRAGVPLYLWYKPGQAEPEELPQILTPRMLIDRALRPRRRGSPRPSCQPPRFPAPAFGPGPAGRPC